MIDEFVVGRRLPVDVDGGTEVVEDLVERPESGVVAPAVDGSGNAALDMSIHSKLAVTDHSLAYIGSGEVRDSSMNLNGEAGYLVTSDDDVAFWDQFFHVFWDKANPVSREYLNDQIQ